VSAPPRRDRPATNLKTLTVTAQSGSSPSSLPPPARFFFFSAAACKARGHALVKEQRRRQGRKNQPCHDRNGRVQHPHHPARSGRPESHCASCAAPRRVFQEARLFSLFVFFFFFLLSFFCGARPRPPPSPGFCLLRPASLPILPPTAWSAPRRSRQSAARHSAQLRVSVAVAGAPLEAQRVRFPLG